MAKYQIPPNLIPQLQISLRKEAQFENFNPSDPSLPSPPTLDAALAAINSPSNSSRCERCRGALLRGPESIICVYCGLQQQKHNHPPIRFSSTLGFRWLLQRLHLDASESTEPPIEAPQANKDQKLLKDKVSLSELLDLELKWPDKSKRVIGKDDAQLPRKKYLDLVGVDLDDLLLKGKRDDAYRSNSKQAVPGEDFVNQGIATFDGQRLSLFENAESSVSAVRTIEAEEHDESSLWNASFQSASPDQGPEFLQPSDVSRSPPVDNGSNVDSVVIPAEQQKLANFAISLGPSISDSTKSDLNSNTGSPLDSKYCEANIVVEVIDKVFEPVKSSPNFDWPRKDQQMTTSTDQLQHEKLVGDDEWGDFTGPVNDASLLNGTQLGQPNVHAESTENKTPNQVDPLGFWSTDTSTVIQDAQMNGANKSFASGTPTEVGDSFDFWNDFKSSSVEGPQDANDVRVADSKISTEVDSITDVWNDFASPSARKSDQEISNRTNNHDNSFGAWNDFTQSNSVSDGKPSDKDIPFGEWSEFPSSTGSEAAKNQTVLENDDWGSFSGSRTAVTFSSPNFVESSQDEISVRKDPENQDIVKDKSLFGSWGEFGFSAPVSETQSLAGMAELSGNKLNTGSDDIFSRWTDSGISSSHPPNNQHNCNEVTLQDGTTMSENDDSFDAWSDFTSSSNAQANMPDDKEAVKHDDPFDSWNVSVGFPDALAVNDTTVRKQNVLEKNSYGDHNHSQCPGPAHQDPFLGVFAGENRSLQTGFPPQVSDLFRAENGDVKGDGHPDQINQSETISREAETLISEMRDLSFMLQSSLSIPESGK